MSGPPLVNPEGGPARVGSDVPFYLCFGVIGGAYVLLIGGMLLAEVGYTTPGDIVSTLSDPKVQYSIRLSLLSCTITTILALWVSVPIGYLLSRHNFPGKAFVDAVLDIPIVLPPLVIGLALATGEIDAAAAFEAAALEELFQMERWGEDEDMVRRQRALRDDLTAAAKFLVLARA